MRKLIEALSTDGGVRLAMLAGECAGVVLHQLQALAAGGTSSAGAAKAAGEELQIDVKAVLMGIYNKDGYTR